MSWHHGRLCALDLETTGVDPETARIVTCAVAHVGGGQPGELQTWLVDPGIEIPEEAAAVHGVTTEQARAEGLPPAAAIAEIVAAIDRRPAGVPVIIFNARYDLTVLDREAMRHDLAPPAAPVLVVDPLIIDKHIDRYRKGSRKLDAMCGHYQARLDEAHAAGSDALAAARLAWVLAQRGEVIRRVRNAQEGRERAMLRREWESVRYDLPRLHDAQARWAFDEAASLERYFAEKGEPQRVARDWPVVPPSLAVAA